ncbi:MAG: hypothetical protein PHE88_11885 [Elusimicrobia bacterium]|nr:hypothetical protein [Elusimicrobiota bacterium]
MKKAPDKSIDEILEDMDVRKKEMEEQDLRDELDRRELRKEGKLPNPGKEKTDEKKEKKVIILGEEIKKEDMPKLYEWGRTNPDTLERNIKGMMEKQGFKNPGSAMAILESDLK